MDLGKAVEICKSRAGNKEILVDAFAITDDIVKSVCDMYRQTWKQSKEIADVLRGRTVRESCQNVFNFLHSITYKLDPKNVQLIKSPARVLSSGFADCKGHAILGLSILQNMGLNCAFRFASYKAGNPTFTHVYCVVFDGGNVINVDRCMAKSNKQKIAKYYQDKNMAEIYQLAGVGDFVGALKKRKSSSPAPKPQARAAAQATRPQVQRAVQQAQATRPQVQRAVQQAQATRPQVQRAVQQAQATRPQVQRAVQRTQAPKKVALIQKAIQNVQAQRTTGNTGINPNARKPVAQRAVQITPAAPKPKKGLTKLVQKIAPRKVEAVQNVVKAVQARKAAKATTAGGTVEKKKGLLAKVVSKITPNKVANKVAKSEKKAAKVQAKPDKKNEKVQAKQNKVAAKVVKNAAKKVFDENGGRVRNTATGKFLQSLSDKAGFQPAKQNETPAEKKARRLANLKKAGGLALKAGVLYATGGLSQLKASALEAAQAVALDKGVDLKDPNFDLQQFARENASEIQQTGATPEMIADLQTAGNDTLAVANQLTDGNVLEARTTTGQGVNVRATPNGSIIGTIPNGENLGASTGKSQKGSDGKMWVQINTKFGMGWVRSDLAKATQNEAVTTDEILEQAQSGSEESVLEAVTNENGEPVLDADGNPTYKKAASSSGGSSYLLLAGLVVGALVLTKGK